MDLNGRVGDAAERNVIGPEPLPHGVERAVKTSREQYDSLTSIHLIEGNIAQKTPNATFQGFTERFEPIDEVLAPQRSKGGKVLQGLRFHPDERMIALEFDEDTVALAIHRDNVSTLPVLRYDLTADEKQLFAKDGLVQNPVVCARPLHDKLLNVEFTWVP
jgi:hypothetical protein